MKYKTLVTFQKTGGYFFMKSFEHKDEIPTVSEWNKFIEDKSLSDENGWVVLNQFTQLNK